MYTMMFLYLISSIFYMFIGIVTYNRNKKDPMNRTFLLLCSMLFFWAFCLALMSSTNDPKVATFFRIIATISWSFLYSVFLLFTIFLTEHKKYMKSWFSYLSLFLPSFVSIYLYIFNPVTERDIVKISIGWAFLNPVDKGFIWDIYLNVYYITYMSLAFILLLNWTIKTNLKRKKYQGLVILVTLMLTFAIGSVVDILFPIWNITLLPPLTIFILSTVIVGIAYSVKKYSLMTITNEKVVNDVFEIMNEGLIIVDQSYSISGINQGALNMLNYEEKDLLSCHVNHIFSNNLNISELENGKSIEIELLMKNKGTVPVLASYSTLLDTFGERIGNLLMFQNLTSYKIIQDELKSAYEGLEKKVYERTRELSEVNSKLGIEIEARIKNEKQIESLAYHDQLTGLPNRRAFNQYLDDSITEAYNENRIFAIMFLDLDGFKIINDSLGHDQGDCLLKQVGKRLNSLFRKGDMVSRVGGDEFIILIKDISSIKDVENICDDIIQAFHKPFSLGPSEIYTSTSIGVAVYPYDGMNLETMVKNADISMYKAKESGKGKYKLYDPSMLDNLDRNLILTNDLHKAIEQNELEVYYQSQNDTVTGEVVGLEALIRWNHSEMGLIMPSEFITIAERTGLIIEIGEWVLNRASEDYMTLKRKHKNLKSLGVNLSVNQIVRDSFIKRVENILKKTLMNPKELELEITESILLNDTDYIIETLEQLKELDIRIAVDDFGTDYSSLRYLKKLPLDRIKIAKNFIDGIGNNITDESIIAAVILLGKKIKLNLIAEGVEKLEQLNFLKELECEEIQGYYFHKPMKFEDLDRFLDNCIPK